MADGEAGSQDWRRRYLDTLEELDARTRSWTETERVLRQGLSRLTLAADRSHAVLAGQLETLRTLLRSGATGETLRGLLEEISESIRQLDDPAEPPPRIETRFWGRLFGRKPAAGSVVVTDVLLQLLDRIDVPVELADRRDAVRGLLTDEPGPAALDRAILGIAEMVGEMRAGVERQKGEIETFLKQVAERLGEIDSGFQQSMISQREAYEEGLELDKTVNVQVQEIEQSVSQAEDLEPLKLALQRRIDVIRTHMQQYRVNEERRIERAEREVDQLNQRLQRCSAGV
jgi:hypothetical protein